MAKMGRPRVKFDEKDWLLFEILCKAQCSKDEIAAHFFIDEDTLNRLVKKKYKKTFSVVFQQKRKAGFSSLRAKQYQKAMEGVPALLIWLGKQWLKQTDKLEQTIANDEPIKIEYCLIDASRITKPSA